MTDDISPAAFAAWAQAVGVDADPERLELLRREVGALLGRIAPLDDIDVSGVAIEDAIGGAS